MQNQPASDPLPQPVRELVEQALGAPIRSLAPATGGFSNRTYLAMLGEQRIVLKIADTAIKRDDIRNEARVLGALAFRNLPVAPLLTLAEDDAYTVEVLGWIPGANGLTVLGDRDQTVRMYTALGSVLARFHSSAALRVGSSTSLPMRAAALLGRIGGLALDAGERDRLRDATEFAASLEGSALVHGDPGAHNILWDGELRALLDWEWAGIGNALVDLAWVAWVVRFRQLDEAVWRAFCSAYGPAQASADDMRRLALAQITALLVRTAAIPEMYIEWRRRLRWTLSAEFAPLQFANDEQH